MTLEYRDRDASPAAGTFGPRDLLGLDRLQNSPVRQSYRDMELDASAAALRAIFAHFLSDLADGLNAHHDTLSALLDKGEMVEYVHTMWSGFLWLEGELASGRTALEAGELPVIGRTPNGTP